MSKNCLFADPKQIAPTLVLVAPTNRDGATINVQHVHSGNLSSFTAQGGAKEKDMRQRTMRLEFKAAMLNFGHIKGCIRRRFLQEILETCMCLAHYSQKHLTIASSTSGDALLHDALIATQDLPL